MPPPLAALITILFIIYLFWSDRNNEYGNSPGLWIPFLWMLLSGSRYVSQWIYSSSGVKSTQSYLEGSPIDRAIFTFLILIGAYILFQRRLNWGKIIKKNYWVWCFFLFGIISVLWSDYPDVSIKRWIKALGNVIMVLIILSEEQPYKAAGFLIRRLAFILVPLSVLLIKYYPSLGRVYHRWTYEPMFIGVTTQKNELGQLCLIAAFFIIWELIFKNREKERSSNRQTLAINLVMVSMIAWLLYKADSATSMFCLVVVVSIFVISRLSYFERNPRKIFSFIISLCVLFLIMDYLIEVKEIIFSALGRDLTLTTRVDMWEGLINLSKNPIGGVGYESFWLGDRLEILWERYGELNQAHNGYLEIYLNLGLIGLGLLLISMVSGVIRIKKFLEKNYPIAILRLCLITMVVMYNWTEATFYGVSNMWILFLLSIMKVPKATDEVQAVESSDLKENIQL